MEIVIGSDAYDDHRCLLKQSDCITHPLVWIDHTKGLEACPCESCKLLTEFKKSGKTLAEFRKYLRQARDNIIIDSYCNDRY